MAFHKITILAALGFAFATALPNYNTQVAPPSSSGYDQGAIDTPASYSFAYENNDAPSGNHYGHAEQREGTATSGEYRVLLPDGRTQIVTYTVDADGGYRAELSYEQPVGGATGGGVGGGYGQPPVANTGGYQ